MSEMQGLGDGSKVEPPRIWQAALTNGLKCRCPRCGEGALLKGWVKVRPSCEACGLDFSGHRADDLPPYLTILIVGHLVIPGMLLMERTYEASTMFSVTFWSLCAVVMCVLLLPRMKGAVIGVQWATEMHGFGPGGDWSEKPAPGPEEAEEKPHL